MKQVLTTKSFLVPNSSLHHSNYPLRAFSKYCFVLLFIIIAMLVSSCHKEDQLCKKTVPFKAKFETLEEPFDSTHDRVTGTGDGTNIGKSTIEAFVYFVNFPSVTGKQTLTAANGDKIFSTFSGSAVGPDNNGILLITNNNIITGGTGRYAGATGSFTAHLIADTKLPTAPVTFDGTIILDKCNGKLAAH